MLQCESILTELFVRPTTRALSLALIGSALRPRARIVLFGLPAFFLPGITLVTLVRLFGAYALVDRVINVCPNCGRVLHFWLSVHWQTKNQ
jgi:hypothetical protein